MNRLLQWVRRYPDRDVTWPPDAPTMFRRLQFQWLLVRNGYGLKDAIHQALTAERDGKLPYLTRSNR